MILGDTLLVGEVSGKICIIIDDMSDTAETICAASETLLDRGATCIYAIITHGILSGDAIERIQKSCLKQVIVIALYLTGRFQILSLKMNMQKSVTRLE